MMVAVGAPSWNLLGADLWIDNGKFIATRSTRFLIQFEVS